MSAAFSLARRGLGQVAPNPAVGCILVRPDLGDRVVGRGWTQNGGRPHAETEALRRAGSLALGATAYVTLEPCSHKGQTGPCAEALIDARVGRVVIAMQDPDPRVSGRGYGALKNAGIDVSTGFMESEAKAINSGFIYKNQLNRPFFSWKTATSLDGRIATKTGQSQWITNPGARRAGHLLRAQNDAILVGIGTALADDPDLTCRIPGLENASPVRIVVDGRLQIPLTHRLVADAKRVPTWLCSAEDADGAQKSKLTDLGVKILAVNGAEGGRLDTAHLAELLADEGLTRVLIEGGAGLATHFYNSDLIDRIYWFRAPKIIGGDGLATLQDLGITSINGTRAFTRRETYDMGPDTLELFDRNRSAP